MVNIIRSIYEEALFKFFDNIAERFIEEALFKFFDNIAERLFDTFAILFFYMREKGPGSVSSITFFDFDQGPEIILDMRYCHCLEEIF